MDLTATQQALYKKIQNKKLKELIKNSYTFYTMTEEEKDEFLIWVSSIHYDKNAEKELIQTLLDEAKERDAVLNDPENLMTTPEEKEKLKEVIENEYTEMKQMANKLKTEVSKEKEKEEKQEGSKQVDLLAEQLNNL